MEKAKLEKKIAGLDSERQAFIRSKSSSKDLFDLSQNKFFVTERSGMKYSYNNGRIAADPQLAALYRKIQLKTDIFLKKRYNLVALATLLNGIQIVPECVLSFSMLRIQNIFGNLPLLVNKVGRALFHDFN